MVVPVYTNYYCSIIGMPKVAMITHRNILSSAYECMRLAHMHSEIRYLSYLPLTHILERTVVITSYSAGASISFYNGSLLKLTDEF